MSTKRSKPTKKKASNKRRERKAIGMSLRDIVAQTIELEKEFRKKTGFGIDDTQEETEMQEEMEEEYNYAMFNDFPRRI